MGRAWIAASSTADRRCGWRGVNYERLNLIAQVQLSRSAFSIHHLHFQWTMAKLRVELALSGKAHCAWCDTLIGKGSPRVTRAFYHAECDYSRNNGAATGHNPGGLQDEYMHAQCAFQYDSNPRGRPAACAGGCNQRVSPPRRLLTRFGKPGARCTAAVSAPLYYCFPCATAFLPSCS